MKDPGRREDIDGYSLTGSKIVDFKSAIADVFCGVGQSRNTTTDQRLHPGKGLKACRRRRSAQAVPARIGDRRIVMEGVGGAGARIAQTCPLPLGPQGR